MYILFREYYNISIFLLIACCLACCFYALSYILIIQNADQEKLSAYECGFNPFNDARDTFDIRFYLVAILFLIFDLEIIYLFPWSISLNKVSWFGFFSMLIFLIVLTIGFIYEWYKGALDWE
uniref:NADH-ubiquinone oxidoreductase chain 3 n=1 Tax=Pterocladiophila hemisphaerica TaxID=2712948 RepID=A0A6M3WWG3_9FLOR|nr:Nad3 [Pterocladiophila hemisphaerica]